MIPVFKVLYLSFVLLLTQNIAVHTTNEINNSTNEIPVIISPYNNQYLPNDTCKLSWTSCGKHVSYEIMLSKTADFTSVSKATSKDTNIVKIFKSSEYGSYYWKVRAVKSNSYGDWSGVSCFHVGIQPINIAPGCSGNCATCPHPCGRRRYNPIYDEIKTE